MHKTESLVAGAAAEESGRLQLWRRSYFAAKAAAACVVRAHTHSAGNLAVM